ncbi:MAG TPA: RDD family protein [Blastocatellia bacterium]|nr:RDD family protein [Blastocatellia bacterium]
MVEEKAQPTKPETADPYRTLTTARPGEATRPLGRARVARSDNGSADAGLAPGSTRRYAPPTHSLVGAFEQAGFGLRYGAWMFDFLISLIAIMTFTFVVTAVSRRSVVGEYSDLVIVTTLTLVLFVLNFVVLAGSNGQSAGMRILGIRIVRVDGRPFGIKDAAVRHLVGYPLSMAGFFLGFLWMLWDPRQQGWHDKLARTIVVMSR